MLQAGCLASLSTFVLGATTTTPGEGHGLTTNIPGMPCVVCLPCEDAEEGHIAKVDGDGVLTAAHTECMDVHFNACINAKEHGRCPGGGGSYAVVEGEEVTPAELVALVSSFVETGDQASLSEVLATVPAVHLIDDREAVQIEGCDGTLVAHIPLEKPLFVALAED